MNQPELVAAANARPLTLPTRVDSIDSLRAVTMVLMIFVNDLWSLTDIPLWLEHVPGGVDGMGLADGVFPAFLFIVGMSLPFAVNARRQKGDSDLALVGHILLRSVALLVMGVFLVNGESIDEAATGMHRLVWNVLACVAFVMIWNAYPRAANKWVVWGAKLLAISLLVGMAVIYRGEEGSRFATHWWGILGLIGWSYLAAALVTVFARNRIVVLVTAWIGFSALSLVAAAKLLPEAVSFIPSAISHGTMAGLTMGGVVIATLFQHYRQRGENQRMTLVFVVISLVLIGLSMYTRTFWGLSKLAATPAWLFLCSALTILAFTAIYWLVDVAGKANWFAGIKPAGTDTLLCYLIPYFAYAFTTLLDIHLPDWLLTGAIGLTKSLLFALLCVWITRLLNKAGVRLKL
jgi:heparan-alpha-glucosaminide N-acetyltransferase